MAKATTTISALSRQDRSVLETLVAVCNSRTWTPFTNSQIAKKAGLGYKSAAWASVNRLEKHGLIEGRNGQGERSPKEYRLLEARETMLERLHGGKVRALPPKHANGRPVTGAPHNEPIYDLKRMIDAALARIDRGENEAVEMDRVMALQDCIMRIRPRTRREAAIQLKVMDERMEQLASNASDARIASAIRDASRIVGGTCKELMAG